MRGLRTTLHRLPACAALALLAPAQAQAPATQPGPVTAILGATVVDPSGPALPDAVVLLRDGRITQVGPRAQVKVPPKAHRVEAQGRWLIPGLVDSHVHFFQSGGLYTRPDAFDLRREVPYAQEIATLKGKLADTFARTLRCGLTSVADVGGPLWNFEVRDLAAKDPHAPRVAVAGPLISSIDRAELNLGDPPIVKCATPEEARALVRRQAERKPDFIKIWYVITPTETVEKNRPMVAATIAEAHRLGLRVAVHATELAAAKAALEAGADILVHSVMDADVDEAFLKLAQARKAIYIPTLVVTQGYRRTASGQFAFLPEEFAWSDPWTLGTLFDPAHLEVSSLPRSLRNAREHPQPLPDESVLARNLVKVFRAGITVAMGTDAGNIGTLHGPSIFREMAAMEAAGLTPTEVLRTATQGGAALMGHPGDLGRIAPGALADLLLLDADPRLSSRNLARIHTIFRAGRALDPASLIPDGPEALVQRQLNAYNARNLEAFLAVYSPEVEAVDQDGKVLMKGLDAFRRRYADRFSHPGLHCLVVKRTVLGNRVIDEERITGAGPDLTQATVTYDVKGDRIVRVRISR
ncbi:MAG TPA: amidohydrolase family protein [Holophagaceae bacterium]|nr:amidohydrolase family protein [Holophagaceae bacterium]